MTITYYSFAYKYKYNIKLWIQQKFKIWYDCVNYKKYEFFMLLDWLIKILKNKLKKIIYHIYRPCLA